MGPERSDRNNWELATESIVVQLRWFGVAMGYLLVETRTGLHNPSAVRAFLALGAGYATLDTIFHRMGQAFLKRWPLFVALMETLFIALLCYNDTQLTSPFRWYYLLSTICAAIRYRPVVAWVTCSLHVASFMALAAMLKVDGKGVSEVQQTAVILIWATWASSSLAGILRATGSRLAAANLDLEKNRGELERRVAERSDALRAAQARVIHQEKMAAFGLLAAGIAHEVGNPLAAISSLVQMLRRRNPDPYTAEKLELADRQLTRIQRTIRELVDFSRPASTIVGRVHLAESVDDALGIAKYYQRTKDRAISIDVADDLPPVLALRDHVTQVVLNLVLNAVDATSKGGEIRVNGRAEGDWVVLSVEDDGRGIDLKDHDRIFQPYFTRKPQGTGLGLFVSRQIVEERGGCLEFQSAPCSGTTFTARLPAASPEPRLAVLAAVEEGG
jgi:two-component system, NtrC family, sensor kinase